MNSFLSRGLLHYASMFLLNFITFEVAPRATHAGGVSDTPQIGVSSSLMAALASDFPGIEPSFTYYPRSPLLRAASGHSSSIILTETANAQLIALSLDGKLQWSLAVNEDLRGELPGVFSFVPSGQSVIRISVSEEDGDYKVINSMGQVVHSEVLRVPQEIRLSPSGEFYYHIWQTPSDSIELHPTVPGKPTYKVSLPPLESAKIVDKIFVSFVSPDRILSVRFFSGGSSMSYLVANVPANAKTIPLEPTRIPPASPEVIFQFQAGMTAEGNLIQAVGPSGQVSCHSGNGTLIWSQVHEGCKPYWVVPATDGRLAAGIGVSCIYLMNTATGAVLDSRPLPKSIYSIYEATFHGGTLHLSVQGGDGTQQFLLTARVTNAGAFSDVGMVEAIIAGLDEDRIVVVESYKEETCLVTALKKVP